MKICQKVKIWLKLGKIPGTLHEDPKYPALYMKTQVRFSVAGENISP